jgi:hypothetical protein
VSNEDPTRDLAQDLGYDEDGSTPSERDLEDMAAARRRDEMAAEALGPDTPVEQTLDQANAREEL